MSNKKGTMALGLAVVVLSSLLLGVGSMAWFSDVETSNGNSFTAATLDLKLDGGDTNVVKFTVSNLKPGDQLTGTWEVKNVGTIAGFLDLENIVVGNAGGSYTEAEGEAGDPGNAGNLGELLDISLFVDTGGDGVYDAADTLIYQGNPNGMAVNYELNLPLSANGGVNYITLQVNWTPQPGTEDNKGQGDIMTIDITFELGQTAGQ